MKNLKIGLLIGLFVYLFIGSIPAKAGSLSLSVDPSIIEIKALPPSNTISNLTIQNKSENQVQLQISLKPFKAWLENGELEYVNDNPVFFKNVQILDGGVPIEGITLGPRQEKKLTLNINISKDISVSEYYFSVIFISKDSLVPSSTASLNQLGIATNVLLSVGPKETPDAVLEEFSSNPFYTSGPVNFTIRIKNKGKHFIKPKGTILIKNMFGQSIGKLDLLAINILSQSIRAIPNALWKENFLLGFYTATLNISLSNDGPTFTKSIHFFAFPFQGLIMIVIILISAIITINRVRTRMKK